MNNSRNSSLLVNKSSKGRLLRYDKIALLISRLAEIPCLSAVCCTKHRRRLVIRKLYCSAPYPLYIRLYIHFSTVRMGVNHRRTEANASRASRRASTVKLCLPQHDSSSLIERCLPIHPLKRSPSVMVAFSHCTSSSGAGHLLNTSFY